MLKRLSACLLVLLVGACSSGSQRFSVFFQPYSVAVDQPARDTIRAAASVAHGHPLQPVLVVGYAAPPDPGRDIPDLSNNRAAEVRKLLVADGVDVGRISVTANGITDPGIKPNVSVRRVDIQIGQPTGIR